MVTAFELIGAVKVQGLKNKRVVADSGNGTFD